jgi:hypothetical protein
MGLMLNINANEMADRSSINILAINFQHIIIHKNLQEDKPSKSSDGIKIKAKQCTHTLVLPIGYVQKEYRYKKPNRLLLAFSNPNHNWQCTPNTKASSFIRISY